MSWGVPGEGAGVTDDDIGGVVATGDDAAEAPPVGEAGGGVSSWPITIEKAQLARMEKARNRAVIYV